MSSLNIIDVGGVRLFGKNHICRPPEADYGSERALTGPRTTPCFICDYALRRRFSLEDAQVQPDMDVHVLCARRARGHDLGDFSHPNDFVELCAPLLVRK
jgi:hypothetical protein